jgi:hypothetical protein
MDFDEFFNVIVFNINVIIVGDVERFGWNCRQQRRRIDGSFANGRRRS